MPAPCPSSRSVLMVKLSSYHFLEDNCKCLETCENAFCGVENVAGKGPDGRRQMAMKCQKWHWQGLCRMTPNSGTSTNAIRERKNEGLVFFLKLLSV